MFNNSRIIPCCYFPTKIVVVDDDEVFTETLSYYLPMNKQLFNEPTLALNELLNYQPQIEEKLWLKTDLENDPGDGIHEQSLTIKLNKMKDIVANDKRYQDISVLIMDYKMPGIDGVTLLEQLKTKPFKKILLTDKGDDRLGIETFNEGLIDYFVPKNENDVLSKLKTIIEKLKAEYFLGLTRGLRDYSTHISNISSNHDLHNYFYSTVSKYSTTEFYLIDLVGTYVLLDEDRKKHYLVAHSDEQLYNLASAAEQDGATKEVVQEITAGLKIPFFGENKNYWEIPGKEWGKYLYSAIPVELTNKKLYVSLVEP